MERRGQREAELGEGTMEMDVENETRSGVSLEGRSYQIGRDKMRLGHFSRRQQLKEMLKMSKNILHISAL